MSRTYQYRKGIVTSIGLSYIYRGLLIDPSLLELNKILDDYLLNGTPYINKEINIENSSQIRSSYYNRYSRINYKMVINLYNDALKGDTFTITPI